MFLSAHGGTLVLWIHMLAASLWIGGQATIAVLVPMLRAQPRLLSAAARRYQWLAWTAFGVLVVTGLANMHNAGIGLSDFTKTPQGRTLTLKLAFVALSGIAAAVHAFVVAPRAAGELNTSTRAVSATLGALSLLAAVTAALYGVIIAEA